MKTTILLLAAAVCFHRCQTPAVAQDESAARAASERAAAEEGYRLLRSTVDGLVAAQADFQRRLAEQAEEFRALRASVSRIDTSSLVTRDEFNRLVDTVKEIERKREADRTLILDEFDQLKRDLRRDIEKLLSASPGRSATSPTPAIDSPQPAVKPADGAAEPFYSEFAVHKIGKDHTFSTVAAEYNKYYKDRGKRTSVELIQKANPKAHPLTLQIGQEIIVPLIPTDR